MSIADISPDAVLHHIRAGKHTRAELGAVFEVLPGSHFLKDAITDLLAAGLVVEHVGVLHPNDLIEQLPHGQEA